MLVKRAHTLVRICSEDKWTCNRLSFKKSVCDEFKSNEKFYCARQTEARYHGVDHTGSILGGP